MAIQVKFWRNFGPAMKLPPTDEEENKMDPSPFSFF